MVVRFLDASRSNAMGSIFALMAAGFLMAASSGLAYAGACNKSTAEAFKACNLSAQSDFDNALGTCDNIKSTI